MIEGSCLCGQVAWELQGPLKSMAHCHCSTCRKAHGTAFATFVTFPSGALRWVRGSEQIQNYESSKGSFRAFCGRCGSKLPSLDPFPYAMAGPLSGELGIRPSSHIFATGKAPWHDITDATPQFEAYSSGAAEPIDVRRHTEPAAGKIRGACLCGAAAYEIDGPLEGGAIVCCHCSRCRRARASAHASNLFVSSDAFRWLWGSDELAFFKCPDARYFGQSFCTTCGSPMPAAAVAGPRRQITAGTLDDDPGVREGLHIFVGSKASWHEITDDLPRYEELPGSGFPPVAQPRRT